MNAKIKTIAAVALFALLLAGAGIAYQILSAKNAAKALPAAPTAAAAAAPEKIAAPDFTVYTEAGAAVTLSSFAGKPVVINFWASWCPPCKAELPDFEKVYGEVKNDVVFMMVDLVDGQRETVEKGAKFIADAKYDFPVYFDTKQEAAYLYGINAIPTTLFIDSQGFVAAARQGQINEAVLRKGIEMAGGPAAAAAQTPR